MKIYKNSSLGEWKMSGMKDVRVTMTRTQRDSLLNSARRAEESAQQARQREQVTQNALNNANRQLDSLNRTLNNEIAGLHEDMQQMAQDQNRRLQQQANEHNRRLQEQARSFNNSITDVNRRMESQRVALEGSINQVRQQTENNRQQLQNAIDNVNARIDVHDARDTNHRRVAEFWISQVQAYIGDIKQYRHDMFTPGQLAKWQNELDTIQQREMAQEAYQTAMASARSAFNNVVELKENVVNAESEWTNYHSIFVQSLADAQSNLNYHQNMQFTIEMEHGNETVDSNINFWTNNALGRISDALEEVKAREGKIQEVPTAELIQLLDRLSEINSQMEIAANEAKEALISSQHRAEMANILTSALSGCGWDFHEATDGMTYEGEQHNRPVHIKMSDGMDNEIVAIITPDTNLDNKLELHFFYETNDEERQRAWIESMQNSLKESGLNVSTPVCREGYESTASDAHSLRNIQETAARKVETVRS